MCTLDSGRLMLAPEKREFNHENNCEGHLRFPRTESSSGERRIFKKIDRNVNDETSKDKKYILSGE